LVSAHEVSACQTGSVAVVYNLAPACFDACSASCPSLGQALDAYLSGGGPEASLTTMCSNVSAFACFVQPDNAGKCSVLLQTAKSFGISLPASESDLHESCAEKAKASSPHDPETPATLEMAVETTNSACRRGYVQMARRMAPRCIDQCQASCTAVDDAIGTYMTRGKGAAMRSVCNKKWAFQCFVRPNHISACHVFFVKAKQFGFDLPASEHDLNHKCSRALLAANVSSSPDEEASVKASNAGVDEMELVRVSSSHSEENQHALRKDDISANVTSEELAPVHLEASVETAGSACRSGYVGMVREMAPLCIDQCSGSCHAIGKAINAYMTQGGQPAAMRSVCRNKWAFACFVKPSHVGNCRVFFNKARSFGVSLPASEHDLNSQCGRMLSTNDTVAESVVRAATATVDTSPSKDDISANVTAQELAPVHLEASVETAGSACRSGYVGMVRDMAPACIDQCSGSCHAIGKAITAYMTQGGQTAAMRSVCRNKWAFACFVKPSHVGNCRVFFNKARSFGVSLPASEHDLNSQCGRMLSTNDSAAESVVRATTATIDTSPSKAPRVELGKSMMALSSVAGSDACQAGYMSMVYSLAPGCIDQCRSSCSAVGDAITAYMTGGHAGALRSVCSHQDDIACFVRPEHVGKCQVFFQQAQAFGVALPSSEAELTSQCNGRLLAETPAQELQGAPLTAVVSLQATAEASSADACTQGSVKLVHDMASECVGQCPQSCPALGEAIDAYFGQGLVSAKAAVCRNKNEFACFLQPAHLNTCRGFFATAAGFGIELPSSEAELEGQCSGRRLRGSFLV